MAITVADLILKLEHSFFRGWVAGASHYDGSWLVRNTPDSPFKRLNNVTPLDVHDDHDIEQRVLAHCGSHLDKPLAMRLIPISAPSILNYVERNGWTGLASVGVFVLDLQGRNVLEVYENSDVSDLPLFVNHVLIDDISIMPVDAQQYAEISIKNHAASLDEVKALRQLVDRCEAKAYPLVFKKNGEIFANMLLVEDKGIISMFDFAISPDRRGQGLGRQSFKAILDYLRQFDVSLVWLQIESTNSTAFNLYKSFGFTKIYAYDYFILENS